MSDATPDRASDSHRVDALRLLVDLGWRFLDTADALALRGGTRETILRPRLVDVLQTRRFDYRGQPHPLSPGGIDQIVREVQALNLVEGLLPANERLHRLLTLGVTVTELAHRADVPSRVRARRDDALARARAIGEQAKTVAAEQAPAVRAALARPPVIAVGAAVLLLLIVLRRKRGGDR